MKGRKQDFADVRPITFTPVFPMLCESFLADWLKVKIIPNVDTKVIRKFALYLYLTLFGSPFGQNM